MAKYSSSAIICNLSHLTSFYEVHHSLNSPFVLVRLDHVASRVVNADHSTMNGCCAWRSRLHDLACHTTADRMAAHRKSGQRRVYPCAGGLGRGASERLAAAIA